MSVRDGMKRSCDEVGRYHYIRDGLTGGVITNVSQRFRKVKQPAIVDSTEYLVRSDCYLCYRMRDRSFYFAGKRLRERVGDWYSFQNRRYADGIYIANLTSCYNLYIITVIY